jgi:hypothetical protein
MPVRPRPGRDSAAGRGFRLGGATLGACMRPGGSTGLGLRCDPRDSGSGRSGRLVSQPPEPRLAATLRTVGRPVTLPKPGDREQISRASPAATRPAHVVSPSATCSSVKVASTAGVSGGDNGGEGGTGNSRTGFVAKRYRPPPTKVPAIAAFDNVIGVGLIADLRSRIIWTVDAPAASCSLRRRTPGRWQGVFKAAPEDYRRAR